jgi:hypothetical protein
MPTNIRTKLRFIDETILNNAGNTNASLRYIANGLFDVDPRVASRAIPGFTEMMQIYQNYRVESCRTVCQFVSKEAFELMTCTCFNSTVAFSTNTFTPLYYGNKFSKQTLLPPNGRTTKTVTNSVNMSELWGNVSYYGDVPNFMGTPSTNPTQNLNFNVGISTPNGSLLVSGATMYITMEFVVEFSNVKFFTH